MVSQTSLKVVEYLKDKDLFLISMSFLGFQACYWISRGLFPFISKTYNSLHNTQKAYWCASVVSTVHSILLTLLAAYVLISDPEIFQGDIFHKSEISRSSIGIFLGYLVSDILLTLYFRSRWSGWLANMIHHLSLLSVWTQFYFADFGHYFANCAHLCEVTTPFVNQRWFFYESKMKNYKIYKINGGIMTALWFLTRIVLYTYLGVKLLFTYDQWLMLGVTRFTLIYFCYFIGLLLQYFWFKKIMDGLFKTLRGEAAPEKTHKNE